MNNNFNNIKKMVSAAIKSKSDANKENIDINVMPSNKTIISGSNGQQKQDPLTQHTDKVFKTFMQKQKEQIKVNTSDTNIIAQIESARVHIIQE